MNKNCRERIYHSNIKFVEENDIEIPKTTVVKYADIHTMKDKHLEQGRAVLYDMTTDVCARYSGIGTNIVVMNFASRFRVGGGYTTGARAQEEDLCRVMPQLYPSLKKVRYPFNEDTVLITPNVTIFRDTNYNLLKDSDRVTVGVVSASAPNLRNEKYDEERIKRTLRNMYISVKKILPDTDTLILGAWGCGAYGNDPYNMAIVMKSINDEYGGLYKNIIFSIPPGPNYDAFKACI